MPASPQPNPLPPISPLVGDADARLPAAAYLRYESRADGWSAGRQAACLAHLADNGVAADAIRSVGMSSGGCYALRRTARGYAFNLGWEAALIIARRIVADNLMTSAIKGEEARWVREDGVTTYTRQNPRLSMALLDRVNPATALPEVLAVAVRFDCFLQMIDEGLSAQELWECFFDEVLGKSEIEARARVRAALLLSEESAGFDEGDAESEGNQDDAPIEYKSMDGPPRGDARTFPLGILPALSHDGGGEWERESECPLISVRKPMRVPQRMIHRDGGCSRCSSSSTSSISSTASCSPALPISSSPNWG